ncbi:hypothetical protein PTSG_01023 [Salpingoeca rosetta]|uniref:Spindle pole body component n=1 Tax=Salpingoeca rosetta (strain ATCC 50818 / BSB-021) TaxID=946362 RepID=F2TY62_SALR5|nr:uncharacterized protein PTSG_01023 [Salpingoeca rosetta]EGD76321.1 hypothetical protein PTSG_01023 [Salpingoeca rosetta]|eukprot:XP_004998496.1 hypothetical protein PTSG_01023 [Salpingoeca rosetta]
MSSVSSALPVRQQAQRAQQGSTVVGRRIGAAVTKDNSGVVNLSQLPQDMQEQAILNDLLFVLLNVTGTYIAARRDETTRAIKLIPPPGLDPQLKRMVERILPCCADFATVSRFIAAAETPGESRVNQALAEGLRDITKDYYLLIAQLEHQLYSGNLTLQKLQFCLQPTHFVMEKLSSICLQLLQHDCRGAQTLSILHQATQDTIGQAKLHALCCSLAAKASRPYLDMVGTWIYDGLLTDPASEFMVRHRTAISPAANEPLTMQCELVPDNIPSFLEDVADLILETGRYLRVLAQCERQAPMAHVRPLVYVQQPHEYRDIVQTAHDEANQALLLALRRDYRLMQRLTSVRNYFFMRQGDLFIHFLDTAEEELSAPHQAVNSDRLSSLLELALRTSSAASDPFKDDLRCGLARMRVANELTNIIRISRSADATQTDGEFVDLPRDLPLPDGLPSKEMTGFDLFTLEYNVDWPISLILDHHAMRRYQFLFRFIFEMKDVEQHLVTSVVASAAVRRSHLPWMQRAFSLRQRMLTFVQTLEHYVVFVVIEPHWSAMQRAVREAKSIDDLLAAHNDFLDTCLRKCMLTNERLLKTVSGLLRLSKVFALYMKRFVRTADTQLRSRAVESAHQSSRETVLQSTTKAEATFYKQMGALIMHLTEVAAVENEQDLAKIVLTLNYNGFYDRQVHEAEMHQRTRAQQREEPPPSATSPRA